MVEGTALEMRQGRKLLEGSNPSLSATTDEDGPDAGRVRRRCAKERNEKDGACEPSGASRDDQRIVPAEARGRDRAELVRLEL